MKYTVLIVCALLAYVTCAIFLLENSWGASLCIVAGLTVSIMNRKNDFETDFLNGRKTIQGYFKPKKIWMKCFVLRVSLYVSDLAVIGWTHKLPPRSTWWGRWVRSVDRAQVPPFLSSPPGPRPCWDAGGRRLEREPEQGPKGLSWPRTAEMAAPRSWTCLSRGWTPPGWAARRVVTTQNRLEPAAVTRTVSGIAMRWTWCQGGVL